MPVDYSTLAADLTKNNFNVHDHLKNLSVPELKALCDKERSPFALGAINIVGDLNIGVMIRTASLLGAEEVLIFGRRRLDSRSIVGAQNYIQITKVDGFIEEDLSIDPNIFVRELKNRNYLPIFIEQGGEKLGSFSWPERIKDHKPILVMGHEGGGPNGGIPPNLLASAKEFPGSFQVSIPQKGCLRSFNVSSAASMVMWDLCKEMNWL